jgi:hypothetical protein
MTARLQQRKAEISIVDVLDTAESGHSAAERERAL